MDDLEHALVDAWYKHRSRILSDPAELQWRLARRRSALLRRPPRAWCLAVRASDTRVDPFAFACVPEDAAYPARYRADHSRAYYGKHTVTLTAEALRKLCRPVRITPPGQKMDEVGELLGCHPENLRYAMWKGIFKIHYVPNLGGRRGKPVPLIYADRLFDPSAGNIGVRPDPIWGTLWQGLSDLLPDDMKQTLTRIPVYLQHRSTPFDPDRPGRTKQSRRMPPPPPDWVWYKWKNGQFHDPYAKPRRRSRRALSTQHSELSTSPTPRSPTFCGWRWICPACKKAVRVVYYPLPPFNLLQHLNEKIRAHEADELQPPPPTFACRDCHNVQYFSSIGRGGWNHLVAHLSGGLLLGHEVAKPASFVPVRRQAYRPHLNRPPSRRRQQVLQLLLAGRTYRHIADELGISLATARPYVLELYRQHKVHSRAKLCARLGAPVPLPPRCREIFDRVAAGQSNRRIAAALQMSQDALWYHLKRIYRRYKVHCRKELMAALVCSADFGELSRAGEGKVSDGDSLSPSPRPAGASCASSGS